MDSLDIHDKNDIAGKLYSYLEHEFLKKKDSSEMNKNKGGTLFNNAGWRPTSVDF